MRERGRQSRLFLFGARCPPVPGPPISNALRTPQYSTLSAAASFPFIPPPLSFFFLVVTMMFIELDRIVRCGEP